MSGTCPDCTRYQEREAYFARALKVADGGQYRADWPAAIENLLARVSRLEEVVESSKNALSSISLSERDTTSSDREKVVDMARIARTALLTINEGGNKK